MELAPHGRVRKKTLLPVFVVQVLAAHFLLLFAEV